MTEDLFKCDYDLLAMYSIAPVKLMEELEKMERHKAELLFELRKIGLGNRRKRLEIELSKVSDRLRCINSVILRKRKLDHLRARA